MLALIIRTALKHYLLCSILFDCARAITNWFCGAEAFEKALISIHPLLAIVILIFIVGTALAYLIILWFGAMKFGNWIMTNENNKRFN